MRDVDPFDLDVGARFDLPSGHHLVVVGVLPADEVPESEREGPMYQAELRGETLKGSFLYSPHNIRQGIEGGAEYIGQVAVDQERTPFWCDGCKLPHKAEERHTTTIFDADVCSYGCARKAEQQRRKARHESHKEAYR